MKMQKNCYICNLKINMLRIKNIGKFGTINVMKVNVEVLLIACVI